MVSISSELLESGRDYPSNWVDFINWFPDNPACLSFLQKLRWPEGFVCPRCQWKGDPYVGTRNRLLCSKCRHQTSITAGTLFEKTRTPLTCWFAAAWYITNEKHGVSAQGLQRLPGLGSYQTAWTMLHRYRAAMVDPLRTKLSGIVEVDETYVGGVDPGNIRASDKTSKKSIVAVAVELKQPKGFGRLRLLRLEEATQESLTHFIVDNIAPGSTIRTDGSAVYHNIHEFGFQRDKQVILGSDVPAHEKLVGVHRVASLLKRWLPGTHQGAVGAGHIDAYLNEYAFRFNRRSSRSRGLLFFRLMELAVKTPPIKYTDIKMG